MTTTTVVSTVISVRNVTTFAGRDPTALLTGQLTRKSAAIEKENSLLATIEPQLQELGSALTVSGPVDVTGSTIVLDEADLADWAGNASRTVLTAESLVGVPAVSVPAGGKGKYVVSNTGTALVVTRIPNGMVILVR